MSIFRQKGKPRVRGAREDNTMNAPGGRGRWRPRRRNRGPAPSAIPAGPDRAATAADATQLAIALLTASLDSPELEAWALWALIPEDPAALGDFVAGLHVVSQLLLHELQDATGQRPSATLQRLAILAETRRGTPSAG
jgi:hypothetical protein